jgi:uncharacterized membrane protein YraQ (UPF0718 family)
MAIVRLVPVAVLHAICRATKVRIIKSLQDKGCSLGAGVAFLEPS